MKCLYCNSRQGLKKFKGYCCKAHRKLHKHPPKKVIPCGGCGSPQRRAPSAIPLSGVVYCTRCKRPTGEQHYKWKEGSYIDKAGYRMILIGGFYRKEHRVIWEQANKASLLDLGSIHHIRFDLPINKTYNEPDNLLLLSDKEHGRFHRYFDNQRYEDAFRVLKTAANRQLHYPKEVDNFIEFVLSNVKSS